MMARTKQRVPQGVYKPCRGRDGCKGRGWVGRTATGRKIPHARCGGDGWIRVGRRGTGRGGRRGSGGGAGRTLAGAAVVEVGAAALLGTAGVVVVTVLIGLVVGLALYEAAAGGRRG